jgi:hypothetical protein
MDQHAAQHQRKLSTDLRPTTLRLVIDRPEVGMRLVVHGFYGFGMGGDYQPLTNLLPTSENPKPVALQCFYLPLPTYHPKRVKGE